MEWDEPRRAELKMECDRIGYQAGEHWAAPPEDTIVERFLELLRSVPDGGGHARYVGGSRSSIRTTTDCR